jgi:hypothetical protein
MGGDAPQQFGRRSFQVCVPDGRDGNSAADRGRDVVEGEIGAGSVVLKGRICLESRRITPNG